MEIDDALTISDMILVKTDLNTETIIIDEDFILSTTSQNSAAVFGLYCKIGSAEVRCKVLFPGRSSDMLNDLL